MSVSDQNKNATDDAQVMQIEDAGSGVTMGVTVNNEGSFADVLNHGGVQGTLLVTLSAQEAKVGASTLANRKAITVFNAATGTGAATGTTVYWGYNSGVLTTTGTPIFKNQFYAWPAGTGSTIYVIAAATGNQVRITESA